MKHTITKRKSWKGMLASAEKPVQLPLAHDALTARLIELAGFDAYHIGGSALSGAAHAMPHIGMEKFGEKRYSADWIIQASPLPVLVDIDDHYSDLRQVRRTVQEYIRLGASAIFLEDKAPPKKFGPMGDKTVAERAVMLQKVKAAVVAREHHELFILARTNALAPEGIDRAIDRAKAYLDAGAEGACVEGAETTGDLEKIGRALEGANLAATVVENGHKTPWLSPKDFAELGYGMVLYPTTVIFQVTKAIGKALYQLKAGKPMTPGQGVDMDQFLEILDQPYWTEIEEKLQGKIV